MYLKNIVYICTQ